MRKLVYEANDGNKGGDLLRGKILIIDEIFSIERIFEMREEFIRNNEQILQSYNKGMQ